MSCYLISITFLMDNTLMGMVFCGYYFSLVDILSLMDIYSLMDITFFFYLFHHGYLFCLPRKITSVIDILSFISISTMDITMIIYIIDIISVITPCCFTSCQ